MAVTVFETMDTNLELKTKVSDQMEDATISNTMATNDFEHKDVNPGLEKKVGGQMEHSVLATDIIIKKTQEGDPQEDAQ